MQKGNGRDRQALYLPEKLFYVEQQGDGKFLFAPADGIGTTFTVEMEGAYKEKLESAIGSGVMEFAVKVEGHNILIGWNV